MVWTALPPQDAWLLSVVIADTEELNIEVRNIVHAFLMLVRSMSVNSAPGAITVGVAVGVAWKTSLETILPSIPVPWIP